MRTGALELLRDLPEPARLAVAQLDLELDELGGDALRVHDRDLVDGHLRRDVISMHE